MRPSWVTGAAVVLAVLSGIGPTGLHAQASLFAGGGAALPLGDLGDVAYWGVHGSAGGTLEIGTSGLALGATASYARLPHRTDGDRSEIYGMTVLAGYTLVQGNDLRLRGWGGLGGTVHAKKSDAFPGLDASKQGLSVSAGVTVDRAVGPVGVFAAGFYTKGLGDLGSSGFPSDLITLGGGVSVPLGRD